MITVSAAKHIRRRIEGRDPLDAIRELTAECDRVLAKVKADRARMKAIQKPKVPGVSRDERRRIEDSREDAGKAAAMERAKDFSGLPRCEVWDGKGANYVDLESIPSLTSVTLFADYRDFIWGPAVSQVHIHRSLVVVYHPVF